MSGIISFIWSLIGPQLVEIAVSLGLPKAIEVIMATGWPTWIKNFLVSLLKAIVDQIGGLSLIAKSSAVQIREIKKDVSLSPVEKKLAIREVKAGMRKDAKNKCRGTACAADLVPKV